MRHSSSQKENKFAAAKQLAKNVRTEDPIIRAVVAFLSKALLKKLGSSYAQKESAKIFLNCSLSLQSVENCSIRRVWSNLRHAIESGHAVLNPLGITRRGSRPKNFMSAFCQPN